MKYEMTAKLPLLVGRAAVPAADFLPQTAIKYSVGPRAAGEGLKLAKIPELRRLRQARR
jgi:hypothetical protein